MESANIHHQLQDQLVGSSSLSTIPSSHGVGNITNAWSTPNSFLNTNGLMISSYPNQENLNPREARHQEITLLSSQYNSMAPDLGLIHWANNNTSGSLITSNNHEFAQDLHFSRIKEEMSDHYYLKYNEMLSSCPSSSTDIDLTSLKNEQRNLPYNDIGMKIFLNSFSCGDLCPDSFSNGTKGRGLSHQIFPTINISNSNQMGLTNPGSLDMNLQALDLLTSSRFSGNFSSSLQNQIGLMRDGFSYGFGQMQQSHQTPVYSSHKTLAPSDGGAETKRSSNKMEHPKTLQNAQKKSRLERRTSCPPFKVRKEKLGDRIAALQQLVAPFGKTDTASVLMEAIGYIKFLQNQVETLSVPYMKASRNNTRKVIKESGDDQNKSEDPKRDLKSRGLCLVPLSCLSYITDGGGATVWPPAHFSSGAAT